MIEIADVIDELQPCFVLGFFFCFLESDEKQSKVVNNVGNINHCFRRRQNLPLKQFTPAS
jgi:hypothetical protein